MLKLNPEKESLLNSIYGFEIVFPNTSFKCYKYKGITILPMSNPKHAGEISFSSLGRAVQNKLYDLIKDDVLILAPNTVKETKITRIKTQMQRLEHQLKELEESEDE